MSRLLIVIVNYRTPQLAVACLRSLDREIDKDGQTLVTVVENDSQDDSAEILTEAIRDNQWESWANLQVSDKNLGYAGGNNLAIASHLQGEEPPEYILLLNPDTEVRAGAIKSLIQFMEESPQVGIAGSRIENSDQTPRYSAFRFPTATNEFLGGLGFGPLNRLLSNHQVIQPIQQQPHPTDWVSGACMIIRRQVIEEIGLMDTNYFLYYEETDFCMQAKKAGWQCWYVPSSIVMHLVGQSTQVTGEHNTHRRYPPYWFDSRRYFFKKNRGRTYLYFTNSLWLLSTSLGKIKCLLQGQGHANRTHLIRDFVYHTLLKPWVKR